MKTPEPTSYLQNCSHSIISNKLRKIIDSASTEVKEEKSGSPEISIAIKVFHIAAILLATSTLLLVISAFKNDIRIFQGHTSFVTNVAFSSNGKYVISSSLDNTLRLWDVQTEKSLRTFEGYGNTKIMRSVAFSSDGKSVISGSDDNTLRLWDIHAR